VKTTDAIVLVGIFGLIVLELRHLGFVKSFVQDRRRICRNYAYLLSGVGTMLLLSHAAPFIRSNVTPWMEWNSLWWEIPLCFILAEFLNYVIHVAKHRNKFLWKLHFQHHIESSYDIWLVSHNHAVEVVVSGLMISGILALAGMSPLAMQIYFTFYTLAKTYQHSANSYSLGPLDYLIVSPAYHRVHHHKGESSHYASTLTIFDILFRTVRWPRPTAQGTVEYGISADESLPFGWRKELTYPIYAHRRADSAE